MSGPACRYNGQQSCFRRCRCPCDGCAVGRVDTYEPPDTPYDDQDDMEDQVEGMDDEWLVHHDIMILQDQDNFDPAAGEDGARGPVGRGVSSYAAAYRATAVTGLAVLVVTVLR